MRPWVLIPHFYQPPTQSLILTEQILRSCYLPFLDVLIGHPQVEMSLNLSASLILQLERIQNHDFFQKIKILVERNQVEFLNSAIFHPILPLTPDDVILRQIKESTTVIERFTGVSPTTGFFPPELAINEDTLELLSKNGVDFVVVDESSVNPEFNLNVINENWKLKIGSLQLLISSRSLTELIRSYPRELKAESLIKFVNKSLNKNEGNTIVSATDVEVFGHHYSERIHMLKDLFESDEFKFIKAGNAIKQYNNGATKPLSQITASSWQTTNDDLIQQVPFAMWHNPKNPLQNKYQELANMAHSVLSEVEAETTIENISHQVHSAQNHFDQGISSCHSYWLSNSPWWHPDMVELGATNLVKCIRTLPISQDQKRVAENFYHNFMLEVWSYHWSGVVEERYKNYDEKRPEILKMLPQI